MMVDLRSDTLTRPTAAMRQAMASAEVGDDQYGEDPTVNLLEEEAAELLGKEAALYVTSGTMGNQLALRTLTRPGDAVIAGARQHLVLYENGAGPLNAGVSWLTTADEGGTLEPEAVERAAVGSDYHMTKATLIAIEDTHMASGGRVWPSKGRAELAAIAAAHGLKVHLDGARIWHAAVASGVTPAAVAADADTVMCCLSKGLGAPIGSLLAGPAEVIAAAGLVALKTMRDRLVDDHARAARLAEAVADRWPEAGLDLATLDTNIVIFGHADPAGLIAYLGTEGIKAGTVAPGRVRFVTHYDVDDAGIDRACQAIAAAPV
jgi:threonine aldolase